MAIISLRAYNREIEGMIDNGQLDEAVAHCRHILATFPKHIASYRLLGKAHLEQQRISDATDIFQRVLTAIPDDFISNVGMSIIREDENNLDAAIWHMELAYEAQPANVAIQDELRRLYGRRDGMQPPKVRLTRGALARMYAKGGLFDQAIAELRAAISEDPNRPDLQLLLAQMFYQTSQRVEAVETSANILKKIPLCLEANRIMAVSLPEAEGSDAVKNYRQIVIAMDPYYAFAEPDAISSEQVPENAVTIEKLEWKSGIQIGESANQPTWATSLGISMEKPSEENIPDWLKSAEAPPPGTKDEKATPSVSPFIWDTQEVEKIITDTSKPEGDIPDWMKDAGWKPATGETAPVTEQTKPPEPSAEAPTSDEPEKAEIPEWLQGITPLGPEKQDLQPKEDDLSNPWLQPHQPGPTDSIIQWLEEKKPEAPATTPTLGENLAKGLEEEMPDWLKDIDVPQTTPTQEGKPAKPMPAFTSEPTAFTDETENPESAKTIPEAASSEETIKPAEEAQPAKAETVLAPKVSTPKEPSAISVDEIPDWLREIAGDMPVTDAFVSLGKEPAAEVPMSSAPERVSEQPFTAEEATTSGIPPVSEEIPTQPSLEIAEAISNVEHPAATEELPTAEVEPISAEIPPIEQPVVAEAHPEVELSTPAEQLPTAKMASMSEELPATEEEVPAQELPKTVEAPIKSEIPAVTEEFRTIVVPISAEEMRPPMSPTGVLEWKEDKLPDWVKEISETAPSEAVPAPTQLPSTKEVPVIATKEPVGEAPLPIEEKLSAEVPTISEEIPATEVTPLAEEQAQIEQPITAESGLAAEAPAIQAEGIPEWIKGLGDTEEIEKVSEEPISAPSTAPETPQVTAPPQELHELEQPVEAMKPPMSPTGVLEWKEDKLPDWVKEISETAPSEAVPAPTQLPSTKEDLVIATKEPLGEPSVPIEEKLSAEVPAISEEIPATEVTPLAEEQAQIEQPTTAESGLAAEVPAIQAEGIPEWIKGLGDTEEIEKVSEEPISAPSTAPETPQVTAPPQELHELEQPVEAMKPPISPTGVLEWKEDKLPDWLKEISETAPSEAVPAPTQLPPTEEVPVIATKEPVGEAPLPFEEKLSAEVPAISEEIPATEVAPLVEEQAQIEQPITAETELIAEAPAIQAEEIPEWIKGLGETEEIEKVSEEPILVTSIESETPKATEPPLGQHEVKQPAEAMIPPMSPTGALEWKEEELPAWLKEITETIPDEEAAATIEALPIENIPAIPVEESSVPTEMIAPQVEIGEKIQEEPQPVTGPWVPEVEAPVLAAPVIPVEAEAGPVPVMEELTTKTVEPTPPIPTEQAEMPVEMVSEVDEAALTDARNAISQGQPSQAIGFYKELIKHNYHLGEIIRDLQDALYRFPVNVDMWVTLGDAHNRSDDLQEALNAYTKAEELVR